MSLRWLRLASVWGFLAALGSCSVSPATPLVGPSSLRPGLTFLNAHGPIAAEQRAHFLEVTLLLLIVVLPVLVLTPLFAWRYRYGGSARNPAVGVLMDS